MKKKCDCKTAHRILDKKRKNKRSWSRRAHLKQLSLAVVRHKFEAQRLAGIVQDNIKYIEELEARLEAKKWWFLWLK